MGLSGGYVLRYVRAMSKINARSANFYIYRRRWLWFIRETSPISEKKILCEHLPKKSGDPIVEMSNRGEENRSSNRIRNRDKSRETEFVNLASIFVLGGGGGGTNYC